ncbi:MAG TPA: CPBP family intramembrane glutamic endopeptidase [Longimicrobiales bacterium]|nr:CPBP family intramembrane glutamic endopeptidase [Longimicrobiales bacterium]
MSSRKKTRRSSPPAAVATPVRGWRRWLDLVVPDLDRDLAGNGGTALALDGRLVGAMLFSCLLLIGYYYFGQAVYYQQNLAPLINERFGWAGSEYAGVLPFWFQGLSATFWRILLPLGCILLFFRDSPAEYGYRMPVPGHARIYVVLFVVMVPVLFAASFLPSFQATYPLYSRAGESVTHFGLYQLPYGMRFASVEAFFRGFLLFALFRRLGYYAVPIMTIPYCMIHFGGPLPEAIGSIVAGMMLGYLAIYSRSWLPSALLHWGIALTMDIFSLWQQGRL